MQTVFTVNISNPDGKQTGVKSITLDGEPVEGNILPFIGDGQEHEVMVQM